MAAYYNENDPFAAAWLRELIKAKLIADGEVDERSIELVQPDDLRGFVQCHFFAGIGGWSYALRLAGWPDDRHVWTGSCPCQPFSAAGKAHGADDSRHLWPAWFRLICESRPPVVFGEQVASIDGLAWLDAVYADVEAQDYAIGTADLCGACIGSPDIRQRLWFVAESDRQQLRAAQPGCVGGSPRASESQARQRQRIRVDARERRAVGPLDHAERERAGRSAGGEGCEKREASSNGQDEGRRLLQTQHTSAVSELGDSNGERHALRARQRGDDGQAIGQAAWQAAIEAGFTRGFWADADWIACRDGKARPVEPGTFPLATGLPARVGRLRGYGNSIKPQVAQVFIESYIEARGLDADALP